MKLTRYINQTFYFLFLVLCVFFFIFCKDKPVDETNATYDLNNPEKKNNVIFKIQDTFYFNSDFEKYIFLIAGENSASLSLGTLSRLLDNFIEEKILLEAAKNQNISLTPEEQKQYLIKLSNKSWIDERTEAENEIESKVLLEGLLIDKYTYELVKDIEVGEEEIRDYYADHKGEFLRSERVKVSQILLKTEDMAIEILGRIKKSSEEDFRIIAQESSVGVEAAKGGVMGVFEMNQLPFEMEKVIFSLNEGELSPVVESSYGYHIFRLDEKYAPELISIDEASAEIKVKILDQKIKQFISQHIANLKESMDWDFYPQNLSFPYQRNIHE